MINIGHIVICISLRSMLSVVLHYYIIIMLIIRISTDMYNKLTSEAQRIEQEELDIRCLQLLRAVIHNEERKLPDDWADNPSDNRK